MAAATFVAMSLAASSFESGPFLSFEVPCTNRAGVGRQPIGTRIVPVTDREEFVRLVADGREGWRKDLAIEDWPEKPREWLEHGLLGSMLAFTPGRRTARGRWTLRSPSPVSPLTRRR